MAHSPPPLRSTIWHIGLRLMRPNEPMRPEANPTASVAEGVPSLTVQFKSNTPHRVGWDFDDGTHSDQRDPTHTFDSPGCYNVALTVTDDHGGSARGNVVILVDRDLDRTDCARRFRRSGAAQDEPAWNSQAIEGWRMVACQTCTIWTRRNAGRCIGRIGRVAFLYDRRLAQAPSS